MDAHLTEQSIAHLKSLAMQATAGPWEWVGELGCDADALKDGAGGYVLWPAPMCDVAIIDVTPQNRAYIAAACPVTILALLGRLEAAERDAARYRYIRNNMCSRSEPPYLLTEWEDLSGLDSEIDKRIDAARREG